MNKITQAKRYIFSHTQCYPPICKSVCCTDVPLRKEVVEIYKSRFQRPVSYIANIGHNDPRDPFDSVVCNTTSNPYIAAGIDQRGNPIYIIPNEILDILVKQDKDPKLSKAEKEKKIIKDAKSTFIPHSNYCPFLTYNLRCSIYENRPGICKEFGTLPDGQNRCTHKSSRFDIAIYWIKEFFNIKRTFLFYKELLTQSFKTTIKEPSV